MHVIERIIILTAHAWHKLRHKPRDPNKRAHPTGTHGDH